MKKILLGLSLISLLNACVVPTYRNMSAGLLVTESKDGIYASGTIGSKMGKACSTSILGLVSMGDSSIATAAKNGGISKVSTVDTEFETVLGVYGEYCMVVRGE